MVFILMYGTLNQFCTQSPARQLCHLLPTAWYSLSGGLRPTYFVEVFNSFHIYTL
jgi:hypothetical protein